MKFWNAISSIQSFEKVSALKINFLQTFYDTDRQA